MLQNKSGHFYDLVNQSSGSEYLYRLAEEVENETKIVSVNFPEIFSISFRPTMKDIIRNRNK